MSGGKGGSQSSKVEIPQWIEQPTIRNLARAEQVSQMGYQPYYGPEVAAFTPMQQQAMQSQYDAASAFGMAPMGGNAMAGIPAPTEFTGGLLGYGSGDLFEQSVNEFQKRQPDQAAIYSSQFVGPDVSNQSFYPSTPPGPPYRGIPGGSGGGGLINPVPGSTSGGGAPVITDRPYIDGQYPGGYPTTPSNPGGIPIDNNIMYGQNMYNQGQTMIPQGQNMYNQGQTFQPETVTPPAQNEAMAMDLWSQAQGALDAGDLNLATDFLRNYESITGTQDPVYGLKPFDTTSYNRIFEQRMAM